MADGPTNRDFFRVMMELAWSLALFVAPLYFAPMTVPLLIWAVFGGGSYAQIVGSAFLVTWTHIRAWNRIKGSMGIRTVVVRKRSTGDP